ncbi:hypothetical protein MTP99_015783 [Tenebrio molitor]|nr:hypothetical protein MTP99_015783 [Tenebrio molitor]
MSQFRSGIPIIRDTREKYLTYCTFRSDNCNVCGRCDDPIHRIQSCPLFAEDRATLEDSLGYGYRLPDLVGIPMEHLEGFAKDTSDTTA